MSTVTRFVLKHKLLVLVAWLSLAVAGGVTAAATTKRLTSSFAMPGGAFRTDARIQALYLHNGAEDPIVRSSRCRPAPPSTRLAWPAGSVAPSPPRGRSYRPRV